MNIDQAADPALAAPLAALRGAMQAQHAPPALENALMAAFATRFPTRRWYHAFSPRQWSVGAGSTALVALTALMLTLQATPEPGAAPAMMGQDSGAFIALESAERIEQETDPRVLEADVPRTALAALGLPVSPENAGDSVRAEMLVGADGAPLALRLVSLP
ncbi:hypothetical protein [Massilia sp. TSP1-1-2]|uniref:hypothetical protein n=1 Tax=Massilia sp. TSP1-1-2 TaxID=2804649 RepID=UPI003CEAC185